LNAFATVDIPAREDPLAHGRLNAPLQQDDAAVESEYRSGNNLRILVENKRTIQAHEPLGFRRFDNTLFQITAAARTETILDVTVGMVRMF
jgi:hypothetical protein